MWLSEKAQPQWRSDDLCRHGRRRATQWVSRPKACMAWAKTLFTSASNQLSSFSMSSCQLHYLTRMTFYSAGLYFANQRQLIVSNYRRHCDCLHCSQRRVLGFVLLLASSSGSQVTPLPRLFIRSLTCLQLSLTDLPGLKQCLG